MCLALLALLALIALALLALGEGGPRAAREALGVEGHPAHAGLSKRMENHYLHNVLRYRDFSVQKPYKTKGSLALFGAQSEKDAQNHWKSIS